MAVSFNQIAVGESYSRQELADIWGYTGYQALARGVVTPREDNKIILFVTGEKQSSAEQYEDELAGRVLRWEGPTDNFAEERMLAASRVGEEIHLFYRGRHHSDFTYQGRMEVIECERHAGRPSKFTFRVV
jgi:hypothetical protein